MAIFPQHEYFVLNSEIKPVEKYYSSGKDGGIYEVLRIISGTSLFLEDHLSRFFHSAQLSAKTVNFTENQLQEVLKKLIKANSVANGNVMITFNGNLLAYFIKHTYPKPKMYSSGVTCGILHAERENPNAKTLQTPVRDLADKMLAENGYYEVLLVDHFSNITEGSRSNVFFVSGNELVTSPSNNVLMGITRQKAIQLACNLNIQINEREVHLNELQYFDAAFITGTSPKILPLSKIDGVSFNPQNEIVRKLMNGYNEMINEYLTIFK